MLYLDNAATTKPNAAVLTSFVKVNESFYFNPNSPHDKGLEAQRLLTEARTQIKQALNLDEQCVVFTSGATESNNMALKGAAYQKRSFGKTIITSRLEHPSVLEVMRELHEEGFHLKYVNITASGQIDLEHLKTLLNQDVILLTCMHVNNIMGQIQPIKKIIDILMDYPKVHFHVDAVQAIGKVPFISEGIDSLSLSGHKFNGLKGQGLLILNNEHSIYPIIQGGGQEFGIRSGTVNLPNNVALAKAINITIKQHNDRYNELRTMNSALRQFIRTYNGVYINSPEDASAHILNISFPGVRGEVLVNAFSKQNVMVSTTSACSSKHATLNEVLYEMGISKNRILGSIRLSFDHALNDVEMTKFKNVFDDVYQEVKELLINDL
ncbi:cysteine desulfurase family protein [Staphylococcus felis]|uniref:cysteine desulfurase family protein n=1 Tax=Staphylococcus felis TaxID=46127 RepID=UPI000E27C293|nr:cysteine desulfurase family protein [Staphylococcus felis]REH79555.1 cysteine desulfurase [Staphylococcus felis]REI32170.1 cysteine desulfurase [Staphylococcus felis]